MADEETQLELGGEEAADAEEGLNVGSTGGALGDDSGMPGEEGQQGGDGGEEQYAAASEHQDGEGLEQEGSMMQGEEGYQEGREYAEGGEGGGEYEEGQMTGRSEYQDGEDGGDGGTPQFQARPMDAYDDEEGDAPMGGRMELLSARSQRTRSAGSRPDSGSAMMDLRGSRPNSAAIAQEIEGFEDDFMERVSEEEEELEPEPESEEEDLGPTVEELIERAQYEQQRLVEGNDLLQKKVRMALDFRNRGRPPVNRDTSRLDGVSTRYKSALKLWVETLEERDRVEGHYQTNIFDMKSTLEERIKRADDIGKAYKHFRLEVAKSAEHSKTGRPISERLLAQLEQEDQEKEEEVQRVRLKNIHLSNQLKRIEQTLRQKEELAEGLHLIDFEQLKIENQSLNEKIEERNEELLKLRKKTTTTVQILTHVREKLQFVEKENEALSATLTELDAALSEKRDALGKVKATRDTLRQKGRKIKDASTFITNSTLLNDIESHKEKREALGVHIEELKREYAELSDSISKTNSRIVAMTEELAAGGAPSAMNALRSMQSQKSMRAL